MTQIPGICGRLGVLATAVAALAVTSALAVPAAATAAAAKPGTAQDAEAPGVDRLVDPVIG